MISEKNRGHSLIPTRPVLLFSLLLALVLVVSCWGYVLFIEGIEWSHLFSKKNLRYVLEFMQFLLGMDNSNPAFFQPEAWSHALTLAWKTLKMSLMAIGFAGFGMLITVIPGARITADGKLTLQATWWGRTMFGVIRCFYIIARAVPELFWAMFIIFIFKPGILPGALALGIHNFGILAQQWSRNLPGIVLRDSTGSYSPVSHLCSLPLGGHHPSHYCRWICRFGGAGHRISQGDELVSLY